MPGDLNMKKSWHPSTMANLEKVWLAEQAAEKEQKKYDELKKEIDREKEQQIWREMQEQSGNLKKQKDRLDWMYAIPAHLNDSAVADQPAQTINSDKKLDDEHELLAGRKKLFDLKKEQPESYNSQTAGSGGGDHAAGKYTGITEVNRMKDLQAKIREDPLMAVKRRERDAKKAAKVKAKEEELLIKQRLEEQERAMQARKDRERRDNPGSFGRNDHRKREQQQGHHIDQYYRRDESIQPYQHESYSRHGHRVQESLAYEDDQHKYDRRRRDRSPYERTPQQSSDQWRRDRYQYNEGEIRRRHDDYPRYRN